MPTRPPCRGNSPGLTGAALRDSSSSREAKVTFIDKDGGYYLKSGAKNTLRQEAVMTRYFHGLGLTAEVIAYISEERDWLLTPGLPGLNGAARAYLDRPAALCDAVAGAPAALHAVDYRACPVADRTGDYLKTAARNCASGNYARDFRFGRWGYRSAEEAREVLLAKGGLLKREVPVHGDYCLPNIILDNMRLGGFIDLGGAGVGDRHIDLFWGAWSLAHNLKTHAYRQRFFDAYGRDKVDEEILRVVAAAEVFG